MSETNNNNNNNNNQSSNTFTSGIPSPPNEHDGTTRGGQYASSETGIYHYCGCDCDR